MGDRLRNYDCRDSESPGRRYVARGEKNSDTSRSRGAQTMTEYPKDRQNCNFAIQYLRWLFHSGAANEVGPDACAVLAAVVTLEDEFHYSRAINFFNDQLMFRCGMKSEHAFIRARGIAKDAGLLFYDPGKKRTAGRYFVLGFTAQNAAKARLSRSESREKARHNQDPPNPIPNNPIDVARADAFKRLWAAYPDRDGRKLEKVKAATAFEKISPGDWPDLMRAVESLEQSRQRPKDLFRFLASDWREWLPTSAPATIAKPLPPIPRQDIA
jgi:hypothetical protein